MAVVDKHIIDAASKGNRIACQRIFDVFKDKVYNTSYYMTGNREDALDVSQQIFIKIFSSLSTYKFKSDLGTWIYRIAMNTCYDYLRINKRKQSVFTDVADSDGLIEPLDCTTESNIENQLVSELIDDAIQKLSPKLRSVVILKYKGELSYAEIAEVLNCSIGTVSSRLFEAHKKLTLLLDTYNINK